MFRHSAHSIVSIQWQQSSIEERQLLLALDQTKVIYIYAADSVVNETLSSPSSSLPQTIVSLLVEIRDYCENLHMLGWMMKTSSIPNVEAGSSLMESSMYHGNYYHVQQNNRQKSGTTLTATKNVTIETLKNYG